MHGDARIRKGFGCAMGRQPAAIMDTGGIDRVERVRWIADAVDGGVETERGDRLDQLLTQLGAAFLVAPIPDPHHVALRRDLRQWPV